MITNELSFLDTRTHNASFSRVKRQLGSVIDFCVPVNPYFPTPKMIQKYRDNLEEILTYYPEENEGLSDILAAHLKIPAEHIVLGNGSTELITAIDHLFIQSPLLTSVPTFGRWTDQSAESGKQVLHYQRRRANQYNLDISNLSATIREYRVRSVAISNPNNPTGAISSPKDLEKLLELDLDLLVLDESFIEFASLDRTYSMLEMALKHPQLIVLRSLGKSLGAHGIRLGYTVSSKRMAEKIRRFLPRWNINALAVAVLRDFPQHQSEYEESRRLTLHDREYFYRELNSVPGIQVSPSFANFFYVEVTAPLSGKELRNRLIQDHQCFVRECGNKVGSSSQFLRIAVKPKSQADALVRALKEVLTS